MWAFDHTTVRTALIAWVLVACGMTTDLESQEWRRGRQDDGRAATAEARGERRSSNSRRERSARERAAAVAARERAQPRAEAPEASPPASPAPDPVSFSASSEPRANRATSTPLADRRYTVLIDLDENRLYFKQGEEVLWSAPVGTGTGMRVITHEDEWEFSTPTGRFQVQYKERDPVWIAPDWYFVENNLPVPPANHPSRYMKGTLGVAAVYISPHLAIHGTNRPELIGQRVSHGCIRLENRYALRLYHNVQVGTEVVIMGGEDVRDNARVVDLREGYDPSLASTGGRRSLPTDPRYQAWKEMDTDALLLSLDAEMRGSARNSRWDEIAMLLVNRAGDGDAEALAGLLGRSGRLPAERIEREWGTYLAEVYRGSAVRTLRALSELDPGRRRAASTMIVETMLTLYDGDLDAPSVPWPSNLVPGRRAPRGAEAGWEALLAAEEEHRTLIRDALAAREG